MKFSSVKSFWIYLISMIFDYHIICVISDCILEKLCERIKRLRFNSVEWSICGKERIMDYGESSFKTHVNKVTIRRCKVNVCFNQHIFFWLQSQNVN